MSSANGYRANTINGPFRTEQALGEEILSKRQLYSPLFVRLFHGVHVPAAMPITHELRCRAAALAASSEAVLTGASAAAVRGFDLVSSSSAVECVVPEEAKFRQQRGIDIRRTTLLGIDSEPWGEIRIATRLRAAMDMLTNTRLHKSLSRRVAMLDLLLREGCVDYTSLRRLLAHRRDHGIVRAREALRLANPLAESIPESEMRVWLVLGGIDVRPQVEVYSDGAFLGRLDLAVEGCKLAVEYDGQWHNDPAQAERDINRREALRQAGWEFIVLNKDDLYGNPERMVEMVRAGIRRRLHFTRAK